jgi:hypothetical protein
VLKASLLFGEIWSHARLAAGKRKVSRQEVSSEVRAGVGKDERG